MDLLGLLHVSGNFFHCSEFSVLSLSDLFSLCCLSYPNPSPFFFLLSFSIWFSLIQPQETHHARNRQLQFLLLLFRSFVRQFSPPLLSSPSSPLASKSRSLQKPQKTINIIAREAGDGPGRSSGKHLVIFLNQLLVCFFLVLTARLWGERRAVGILHCCEEKEEDFFTPFFIYSPFSHTHNQD